jgi:hypothetical protein
MARTSIHLEKRGRKDDVILMTPRGDYVEFNYRDGDKPGSYTFELHKTEATEYISDLLTSLAHDADPFEYIQVTTPTGPAVLYNVWELADEDMSETIQNQIHRGLCGEVYYNRFA